MKFADNNFSKDPAVVKYKGAYYLYYSRPPMPEREIWSIGIASSKDLENWEIVGSVTPTQDCEKKGLCAAGAIVLNDEIHLFYQTYGNWEKDAICHAASKDGVTFIKDETNPVFAPSKSWCCGRAIDADVCIFDGKLYLYFATRDHNMEVQKIGGAFADINSDFSFGSFKEIAEQSLLQPELKWEGKCIEAPACITYNDKIYMFYGGSYNCTPQQIGCAVSCDGKFFERVFNEPFIPNGKKGEWNESESGHPFVFKDDDAIYLFYQGNSDNGKSWYISSQKIEFVENKPQIVN